MEEKRLLESGVYPLLNAYWTWADQLLLIRNLDDAPKWIYNNFIKLQYDKTHVDEVLYFMNGFYRNETVEYYDCPLITMQKY